MDHSVVLRGIGSASPLFAKSAKPRGMPNQNPWRGKPAISTKTVAVGVIEALVGVEGREVFEELGMKI